MYIDFTSKQYFFILHALAVMITFYSNDFSSICKEVGEAYGASEADIASACAALTAVNVTAPVKSLSNKCSDILEDILHHARELPEKDAPYIQNTYGYITKLLREQNDIKKSHVNDARCISKHPLAEPCSICYRTKAIRHHNRQIHKAKILKGGIRKANQAPYIVKGFRLWDKVLYNEQECFISGRRSSGYFALRKFDGTTITNSISFKKLRLLEPATNYLIERK